MPVPVLKVGDAGGGATTGGDVTAEDAADAATTEADDAETEPWTELTLTEGVEALEMELAGLAGTDAGLLETAAPDTRGRSNSA